MSQYYFKLSQREQLKGLLVYNVSADEWKKKTAFVTGCYKEVVPVVGMCLWGWGWVSSKSLYNFCSQAHHFCSETREFFQPILPQKWQNFLQSCIKPWLFFDCISYHYSVDYEMGTVMATSLCNIKLRTHFYIVEVLKCWEVRWMVWDVFSQNVIKYPFFFFLHFIYIITEHSPN